MLVIALYVGLVLAVAAVAILGVHAVVLYKRALDLNPLFVQRAELETRIKSLDKAQADAGIALESLRKDAQAAQLTIDKAAAERQWLKDNDKMILNAHQEVSSAQLQLEALAKQQLSAQNKLNDVLKNCQDKQNEVIAVQGRVDQLAASKSVLEGDVRKLETQKLTNAKQEQQTRKDLVSAQNELERVQSEVSSAQSQLNALKAQYGNSRAQYDAQLQAIKSQFDAQLAQKAKDLEDKRKELEVAKASYDVLSQKNIDLQGENHDLEVAINMRRPNANQWGDLERPVFAYKSREKVVANTASEADWLKAFQAQLKNHGIIFSERMIYAFHTGMKVADLSPLVVLAGISGTGKSLLPQLYARAIGMNFVQLAVQPRWDSPQDMLGFFNYTENRFKATELSRLLWQYDRWNNKAPEVPKDDASMPMNLVLLDEMNLARVEYYFSDLLSKLEVRRTIDPNDATSRRAAEIEIECGATKDNADTRRLFVAPNTLFVGTMNEDESTQTLSDKVMDRANVLRFGRPNNLDAKPDTQGFMSACGHKRITLAQWNDHWKKDVEAATGVRIGNTPLTKYMEGINNILATIDRPFAHRVWQAMRLYVANYPDTSAEGIKHAVADQIELKIMPKLNGLQTQANAVSDAFGKLKNQLEVLGDDALTEAFEKAKGGNDIFFKWHGVTR